MFQGFSQQASDFLWGVRFNNDRDWFQAHKQEYLELIQRPLRDLAEEVFAGLTEQCPDLGMEIHVSRIYRDARRLHNRGPYKDHLWFSFRTPGQTPWTRRPVFWFEIRPEGYAYGMGMYEAKPVTMALMRREIDRDPAPLLRLAKRLESRPELQLDAPEYKRPKGTAQPPLDRWYNRKGMDLCCRRGWDETLGSRALVAELVDAFVFLEPYYRYFDRLCILSETEQE